MNRIIRVVGAMMLICGLTVIQAQGPYGAARELVNRVQQDLRKAVEFNRNSHKEPLRYDNAQHALSEFDKDLSRGKFNKGRLDSAINDLKNVIKRNTLSSADRDALTQDINDLRMMRDRRGL